MANGADGRDGAGGNGPRDGFFVEAPQVFQGAATTADDQDVSETVPLSTVNGLDDICGGRLALNGGGIERDRNSRATSLEYRQDIVNGGASW